MKKETIFKHELNESIQAKAAMNCLKNRNNKQVVANQEQEEVDVFELAVEVAQKNASKIARMSEQNACGVLMNELCKLTNRDFDTLDEEGDFDYYQDAALYGYNSVVGYDDEQEEMEVTDAKHALAQLAADLLHYDDGDLDELYYAISDIIDSEGYSPQPDEYEMWIEEHVNEIEDLIM